MNEAEQVFKESLLWFIAASTQLIDDYEAGSMTKIEYVERLKAMSAELETWRDFLQNVVRKNALNGK